MLVGNWNLILISIQNKAFYPLLIIRYFLANFFMFSNSLNNLLSKYKLIANNNYSISFDATGVHIKVMIANQTILKPQP